MRDNVWLRCYYFLCKHHTEDDYCSLSSIIMGKHEEEGYLQPMCMSMHDKKYRRGLGIYEVEEEDGTIKIYYSDGTIKK